MNIIDVLFEQHSFHRFISKGEWLLKNAPHLPLHLMDFLVSILPAIFFALGILHGIMGALVIISGAHFLRQLGVITPPVHPIYLLMNGMLAMANGLLMLLSFMDINDRAVSGWRSLFIINAISILQSLLSLVFSPAAILSVILYILVTIYMTFEFKPYFKH